MAAASASASLNLYNNSRFPSFSSSKSSKTHHFSYKPISIRPFSSLSSSESFYPVINKRSRRFPFPRVVSQVISLNPISLYKYNVVFWVLL